MNRSSGDGPENVVPLFPPETGPKIALDNPDFRPELKDNRFFEILDDSSGQFIGDARRIHHLLFPLGELLPCFGLPMAFEPCLDDKTKANKISLIKDHFSLAVDPDHFLRFMDSPDLWQYYGDEQKDAWARYYVATSVGANYLTELAKKAPELFNVPTKLKVKVTDGRSALIEGKQDVQTYLLWQIAASIALKLVARRNAKTKQFIETSAKEYGEKLWSREIVGRLTNVIEPLLPHVNKIDYAEYLTPQDRGLANLLSAEKITQYAPFLLAIANR